MCKTITRSFVQMSYTLSNYCYRELDHAPRDNTARPTQTPFRPRAARPYYKLRQYYRNEIRAWELQQRKIADAPIHRRRIFRGPKSSVEENTSTMQVHKPHHPSQILRLQYKKRYAAGSYNKPTNQLPVNRMKTPALKQQKSHFAIADYSGALNRNQTLDYPHYSSIP